MTYLIDLGHEIHDWNKSVGWWDGVDDPTTKIFEKLALIHSEFSEGLEAWRKSLPDDHLPQFDGLDVELADAYIRTLDLVTALGLIEPVNDLYTSGVSCGPVNDTEVPVWIFTLHRATTRCGDDLRYFAALLRLIEMFSTSQGYFLERTVRVKMAYNKTRADHKRENRAKAGGKKI